ncbi:hypothetical protein PEL8287_03232 [Roseovarius litorisediminis]|uniref:Uncharacterized protein n=1 Tax=Roseovarius litorisediminis TaxID=1312363 RepID=A0A1Y5TDR5_9RHOB|nr:hypothetical protein [Roseovarius litorisediminis]SLN59692.1 hypothetical protein PEL8287_03232 [Roseovarius litorisediminis]
MPQDLCLDSHTTSLNSGALVAALLGALLVLAAVVASTDTTPPISASQAADPSQIEDWHGNVRRSH